MNWFIVALPLTVSASLLIVVIAVYMLVSTYPFEFRVPTPEVEKPNVEAIRTALGRMYGSVGEVVQRSRANGKEGVRLDSLELVGTVVGDSSWAYFKFKGSLLSVREGEKKNGIFVKKITRNRVLVEINGAEKTVSIPVKTESLTRSADEPLKGPAKYTVAVSRISRKEINRITKDPGIMFREIRLVPYVKGGRTEGFVFEWIKPGSLFHKVGLRRGDVLISINNMSINTGDDAFRILQILRIEPNLKVVVLRNGKKREINVRIE